MVVVWYNFSLWYFLWYFSTTWVPQATPLQYHRNLCGVLPLVVFSVVLQYTIKVPQHCCMVVLWYNFSLWYFLWYFSTTWVPQATPLQYHRNLCGVLTLVVFSVVLQCTIQVPHHCCVVFCGCFFFCGISYGIFSTTWVPQATLLQYHRTLCGTSLSLWYFLWYYAVPQEYHRNTTRYFCKGCKPTSMSFVPTKYLLYRQNIERNSSVRM